MDLEAIPGVGEKTIARLAELDDPESALADGDVVTISRAPGISEARAARIARAAIRHRHGDDGTFLATDRAREIYREVLELLQERAVTTAAERRLETLYPSATASRIEEVRSRCSRALERTPDAAVLETLGEVAPLQQPAEVRVSERCLATSEAETYSRARDLIPEVPVELVEDARDLADLARGYTTVIVLDEAFAGLDLDGEVIVEPDALADPASVVPERTLAQFGQNRDSLLAAISVHREAPLTPPCDLDQIEAALQQLDTDGSVRGDEQLDRLDTAVDDLDAAVSMAESVANDQLRDAIRQRDVTIEGGDLLSLVERGAGVDSLLRRELADEYGAAVDAARTHVVDALELRDHADLAEQAFPDDPTFPVTHDSAVLTRLRDQLTADRDRRATRRRREVAATLADHRDAAAALVEAAIGLDVDLAIAQFARDFGCTLPQLNGSGIAIEEGRSPLLDVPFESVEPVTYEVSGPTLLSGVNSGGKTSTLDLLAVVTILAHMGLPVPAKTARVERFDGLHYQPKSRGTLDAGALESTLLAFGALTEGDGTRLVLVDELEAITEPGASATIVAGILEALAAEEATAVFVSHLAGEIREACEVDVAVDGIEAIGLADGELMVERSPVRDHLARSTPELIVEKLAAERGGFYETLLEKFS